MTLPDSFPLACSGSPGSLEMGNTQGDNVVVTLEPSAGVSLGAISETSGAPFETDLFNAVEDNKFIGPNDAQTVSYGSAPGTVTAVAAPEKQQKLFETLVLVAGSLPAGIDAAAKPLKTADQAWTTENANYFVCLGAHPSAAKLASCNSSLVNQVGATDTKLATGSGVPLKSSVKKTIAADLEQTNVATVTAAAEKQFQALADAERTATMVAGATTLGAKSNVLILGNGDPAQDPGNSSFTFLDTALSALGLSVTTLPGTTTLPTVISGYGQIWWDGTQDLSNHDEHTLESFVQNGGSVYINGDYGTPDLFDNQSVIDIVQALVSPSITVSGISGGTNALSANPNVIDSAAVTPNALTTWTPNNEGTLTGVSTSNTLFPEGYGASGALWDVGQSGGRLAVVMDVNWAENGLAVEPTAMQVAQNLGDFLSS